MLIVGSNSIKEKLAYAFVVLAQIRKCHKFCQLNTLNPMFFIWFLVNFIGGKRIVRTRSKMRKMSFAFKVSLILSYTIILIRDTSINYVRVESNIICHWVGRRKTS